LLILANLVSVTAFRPHSPDAGQLASTTHSFAARNLSALAITETELKLIAAAAIIGFRSCASPKLRPDGKTQSLNG
jgi:hypothetical protein